MLRRREERNNGILDVRLVEPVAKVGRAMGQRAPVESASRRSVLAAPPLAARAASEADEARRAAGATN